jgi:hypothetical protein
MAFGLSAAANKSEMIGSDVAVAYIDGYLGYAADYNITAKAPVSYYIINIILENKINLLNENNAINKKCENS